MIDSTEEKHMCYSCGCGETKKDHGDPRNITDKTFKDAAEATHTLEEGDAKQNTVNLLKKKEEAV
jgi:hypothetical protein